MRLSRVPDVMLINVNISILPSQKRSFLVDALVSPVGLLPLWRLRQSGRSAALGYKWVIFIFFSATSQQTIFT